MLVPATLRGPSGVDTSGVLVLDTGAGFIGLDARAAERLGVTAAAHEERGIQLAERPLSRLELGTLQIDQLAPVLVLDAEIIRRASGRSVLGLAGVGAFKGRALWLDYSAGRLVIAPSPPAHDGRSPADSTTAAEGDPDAAVVRSRALLAPLLSTRARAVRFRFAGDDKMLVRTRFADATGVPASGWLQFVFDTGATKSVLFEPAFTDSVPAARRWRSLRGLVAPTLVGSAAARLTLAPAVELAEAGAPGTIRRRDVDCAAVETDLAATISSAVGEPVAGLLGYSFLKPYRVAIDCTNRVIWLDPDRHPKEERPYEYCQVGLQLEHDSGRIRVLGVAVGSPADQAGIRVGDELVAIGARRASSSDVVELAAMLEGPPGTRVRLVLARSGQEKGYVLIRRRLL